MRSNLSDATWKRVLSRLPGNVASRARRNEGDYRIFVEEVLWVAEKNVVWHALKSQSGTWRNVYVRFLRWSDKGIWDDVAEAIGLDCSMSMALVRRVAENREYRERCTNTGRGT